MNTKAKGATLVTGASSGIGAIRGKGVRPQGWTTAFAEQSEKSFADTLAEGVLPLLDADHPVTRRQREGLRIVRERLGAPGAADRVAELASGLIK